MSRFIAGLSRGLANDYVALAVVETFGQYEINKRYNLRHLERFKGISSRKPEKQVVELMNGWPFNQDTKIVLEVSSFGQILVDAFAKAKLHCLAVTAAEDNTAASKASNYIVCKKDLIANLQFLFIAERLRMKKDLPVSNIIVKELLNYRLKAKIQDRETHEVSKEPNHDGLVFALALACWYGQEVGKKEVKFPSS